MNHLWSLETGGIWPHSSSLRAPRAASKAAAVNKAFTRPLQGLGLKKRIHPVLETHVLLRKNFFVFISNTPGWWRVARRGALFSILTPICRWRREDSNLKCYFNPFPGLEAPFPVHVSWSVACFTVGPIVFWFEHLPNREMSLFQLFPSCPQT